MLEQIAKVVTRFEEIERQMVDPAVVTDHVRLTELAQERSDLAPLVETYHAYAQTLQEITEAEEMLTLEDSREMQALAREELDSLAGQKEEQEAQLRRLLVPKISGMTGMFLSKSVRGRGGMRRRFLRRICCGCICGMRRRMGLRQRLWMRILLGWGDIKK
jgi:protein subunit release factor A